MDKDEKRLIGIFGTPVIIMAITVFASKADSIPESVCFLAMAVAFFAGISLLPLRDILLKSKEVSSGN